MRSLNQAQSLGSTGSGAYLGISSAIFWRNVSVVKSLVARPTMGNCLGSTLSAAKLHSAGISLRLVRSPLAPKMTMTHGDAAAVVSGWCEFMDEVSAFGLMTPQSATALFFLYVAAKLKAHGGQNLGCEIGFSARGKALVERFGKHRRRRAR